jgi:glycosyltransferase involved in cell wall biosynthesis
LDVSNAKGAKIAGSYERNGESSEMRFSVVIPTYNRAHELRETLASIAKLRVSGPWEVIAVDNNSTDTTRETVLNAAKDFSVPLHYVFEPEAGRSAALNAGIKNATGQIIATTDDDVRVEPDWLEQAAAGIDREACDFVGGKVLPIWGGERPNWLANQGGRHWSVIALQDHGAKPVEFGSRYAPLGVNLAFKRETFELVGLWDTRIGRKAGTLLGQEVREWLLRARGAGLKGMYIPEMIVHHVIPRDRLNKRYFRRWFYWNGISRAILYQQSRVDMLAPEETALDFSKVPHIMGVPRYLYRAVLRSAAGMVKSKLAGREAASFDHELWLCFFLGVWRQRWRDRHKPLGVMQDVPMPLNREAANSDENQQRNPQGGR